MAAPSDIQLPASFWNLLSQEDKSEYLRLRQSFHHGQKISSKDRRIVTFRKELNSVLHYLERSDDNREARCILTGVCFAGRVVAVNTRQLKSFLSRCKSSINGSFQQLGYVALRTKAKARNCVITVLPALQNQQNILRQWTCRVVSEDANFCFVSSFSHVALPEITDDDLFEEKKPMVRPPPRYFPSQPLQMAPQRQVAFGLPMQQQQQQQQQQMAPQTPPVSAFRTKTLEYDLPSLSDYDPNEMNDIGSFGPMATSFSMECFNDIDSAWDAPDDASVSFEDDDAMRASFHRVLDRGMTKSKSTTFHMPDDWDLFSDL